jgi:PPE-repeat protein
MVDYGLLPPEINSARIYAGPGAGSLIAAASAWSGLAEDFAAAATGHRAVIETLTSGPWLGPASAQLVSAVSPFITWLSTSAEQAAQTASQAGAAASAYETAFAASVPPPLIATNRALVQELTATNLLGQNSGVISQLEAQYAEFWAQDSGAMYNYAGSAAAATQVPQLAAPAEVADPVTGAVDQAIAAFKGQATAVQTQLNAFGSSLVPRASDVIKTLSSPLNGQGPAIDAWLVANTPFDDIVPLYSKYMSPYMNSVAASIQVVQSIGQNSSGLSGVASLGNTLSKDAATAASKAAEAAAGAGQAAAGAGQAAAGAAGNLGGVAAGLGKAVPIGGLSAPASWTPWHATLNPGVASAIPAGAQGVNSMPMAPPFGQFVNGGYGRNQPTYGFKPSVMAKPPAAG